MKSISKIIFALFLSLAIIGTASASDPSYNQSKKRDGKGTWIRLINITHEGYMSYATYRPTGRSFNLPLGPVGSPTAAIFYPIDYPEYDVCLHITRNMTGQTIYDGCPLPGYDYYIHYGYDNSVKLEKK